MENSNTQAINSSINAVRQRKSIFGSEKQKSFRKPDTQLMLDQKDNFQQTLGISQTKEKFCSNTGDQLKQLNSAQPQEFKKYVHATTNSICIPEYTINKVIKVNPSQTIRIRPSFQVQKTFVKSHPKRMQKILSNPSLSHQQFFNFQSNILQNSKIIQSQISNLSQQSKIISQPTTHILKKSIIFESKHNKNITFNKYPQNREKEREKRTVINPHECKHHETKHYQVKPYEVRSHQCAKVIIMEDSQTFNEINKLSSLNLFLQKQYNLVSNELNSLKRRTHPKEVVKEMEFIEKSINNIEAIFFRQTNEALLKLDEIKKLSSSKGRSRTKQSSCSKIGKINYSAGYMSQAQFQSGLQIFTPAKELSRIENSLQQVQRCSYKIGSGPDTECNHIDCQSLKHEI